LGLGKGKEKRRGHFILRKKEKDGEKKKRRGWNACGVLGERERIGISTSNVKKKGGGSAMTSFNSRKGEEPILFFLSGGKKKGPKKRVGV